MATRAGSDGANTVRFLLDGAVVEVKDAAPTLTVLEYLRDVARRIGTKEGCAEGDCGACTVVLGKSMTAGGRIQYRAINSCIRFLPTIDGLELITVESLQSKHGQLHPVQQAMVDCHGSQCGFCTPGIVMALFALYLESASPSREQVLDALSGNLCRCTGYRPIIEAGCRMGRYPEPERWSRADAQSTERMEALRGRRRREGLKLPGFSAPRTLTELIAALESQPQALVLAGGTDVGLWVTKQLRQLPPIIYIGEVEELKHIQSSDGEIRIGAAVSLTDAWAAIVAAYPQLAELAQRFGSPPVRHSGTLCGNLANGSPIGDAMPVLIALGAEIEIHRGHEQRRLPLERFYLGYQRKDLAPGEFVGAAIVPRPRRGERVASYKVSKRFDQDISGVCGGFAVQISDERVHAARLAFGGMAPFPMRARAAENALIGGSWTEATIDAAAVALQEDFKPLTDLRASAAYRLQVAGNLLRRFYWECSNAPPRLRTAQALEALGLGA